MKRALAIVVALLASTMSAATISVAQYIASLQQLQSQLAAHQTAEARATAQALIGTDVESPRGKFIADHALLSAIARGEHAEPRLAATIRALQSTIDASSIATDPKLLERLRAEERPRELRAGGEVGGVPINDDPRLETVAEKIAHALEWIGKKIEQFYDWLMSWWPHEQAQNEKSAPSGPTAWIVTAVVILIVVVLAVLALEIVRRSKRRNVAPIAESDPIASQRDDDPLSRGSNEWELYAEQLAAAGRMREAIRAWYHAVLVTLYGAGILHFRKGRTNWEYIAALAPEHAWRSELVQLTRRFEREWYGHDESTIEALEECSDRARGIIAAVRRRGVAA